MLDFIKHPATLFCDSPTWEDGKDVKQTAQMSKLKRAFALPIFPSDLLGGNFLYMAKYGCTCRMAPFFSAARYMISPLFSTKSI